MSGWRGGRRGTNSHASPLPRLPRWSGGYRTTLGALSIGLDATTADGKMFVFARESATGRALRTFPHAPGGRMRGIFSDCTSVAVLPNDVVGGGERKLERAIGADASGSVGTSTNLLMLRAELTGVVVLTPRRGLAPLEGFTTTSATRNGSRRAAWAFTIGFVSSELSGVRGTRENTVASPA